MSRCIICVVQGTVPQGAAQAVSHVLRGQQHNNMPQALPDTIHNFHPESERSQITKLVQSNKAALRLSQKVKPMGQNLALNQQGTQAGRTKGNSRLRRCSQGKGAEASATAVWASTSFSPRAITRAREWCACSKTA